MLTPEEICEIETEQARYPNGKVVSIEAMRIVQKHRRWISDENLRDIADLLQISADELDGIATFYNLLFRRPVGRHIVMYCDSVSCWIMGCDHVKEHLSQRLGVPPGGTSSDGGYTLLPIVCLGACDHAPAMLVDGNLHGDLDPGKIDAILDGYK